jgi:hypothetical protein
MPKTYYLSNNLINSALRNVAFVPPAAVYLALYTVAPTLLLPGTECSGGSYTRQGVTFSVPTNGQASNVADVTFPIATAAWGTVVAFGVFDQPSGGNLLYYNNLAVPRAVNLNDQVKWPTGQLIVTEA